MSRHRHGLTDLEQASLTAQEKRIRALASAAGEPGQERTLPVLERNIAAFIEQRKRREAERPITARIAESVSHFAGTVPFLWLHVFWFGTWLVVNVPWTPFPKFDPFPFGLLTTIVSLEAIFLSTFILIAQNRMAEEADDRADLDLQVNLLAEHEITRILQIVDAIADRIGVRDANLDGEVDELKRDVEPEKLLEELHRKKKEGTGGEGPGEPPPRTGGGG